MVIYVPRFRRRRALKLYVLLIVVFIPIMWMFSRSSPNESQDGEQNQVEEDKRTKTEEVTTEKEEIETYPVDINHIPGPIRSKYEKYLLHAYKGDQVYLKKLREMLQGHEQSNGVEFEDDFLNVYLLRHYYNVDEAFKMIINYLAFRERQDYLYKRIEVDFTAIPSGQFATVLPQRHPDGSVIILIEVGKWNPSELSFEDFKRIGRLIFYQEMRNPVTQVTGINAIYDFANTGYKHVMYCTPMNMYLLYHAVFECIPGKYTEVHFVNSNYILSILLTCFKPFLSESIQKMLYFHSSVEELLEYYPKSVLPAKYGGTLEEYYMADYLKRANEEQGDFPAGGLPNLF